MKCLSKLLTVFLALAMGANAPQARASDASQAAIAPQPLGDALQEWAVRNGKQLIFDAALAAGKHSKGSVAGLADIEALSRLLEGTGLVYRVLNDRTISILPVSAADKNPAKASTGRGADSLTLARADQPLSSMQQEQSSGEQSSLKGIPELLVKGSRSLNLDIERTEDDPQPYVVFDSTQILRSQATNLEDFLKTRLPMNTTQRSSNQGAGAAHTFSTINLRGLGADETLILIDGRRAPKISAFGEFMQPDLNGIPLAAIERVEVLPSTAGGIYGGSATGGVINVVLKRNFQGIDAGATYTNTFDTDAGNLRFDLSAGLTLEGGRTQLIFAGSFSESNPLLVGDRDFYRRSRAKVLRNNPDIVAENFDPPYGGTVNLRSDEETLTLDPEFGGTALPYAFTHLPLGYAGPDSDNGAALVANAGTYNLDLPNDLNGRAASLLASPAMRSVSINLRREFIGNLEAFVSLSSMGNKGIGDGGGGPNIVYGLPGDAPNNPFQETITLTYPTPNMLFHGHSLTQTLQASGGVIAHLSQRWVGELDFSWSRSRQKYQGLNSFIDEAGQLSLASGLDADDGRPALNVLQEGNIYPIDFSRYLLAAPNDFQGPHDTVLRNGTLRLSGPAVTLPSGPLTLSALLERRQEQSRGAFNGTIDPATAQYVLFYYPPRSQDADSVYVEARAPLISRAGTLAWARELELQASVRHDRYTTTGDSSFGIGLGPDDPLPEVDYSTGKLHSTDYTFGLRYVPIDALALRASVGTGFLPPSIAQIASRQAVGNRPLRITDPQRGNTEVYAGRPITFIGGGGPDVGPETSRSWSAGAIFTPKFMRGLRFSLDYTRIAKVGEIQTVSRQFIVTHENDYPDRVRRGPKLATDPAAWAGPINYIDTSLINIATTQVEAWDIQTDYEVQTEHLGHFHFSLLATCQTHYKNQLLPESPVIDTVGYVEGPLEWRGNAGLSWTRGPLSLDWNTQFYDSYFITYQDPDIAFLNPGIILNQGSDSIPSQLYHDMVATYRFDRWNTEISAGIQNVFNTSPPIVAELAPFEAYSTYGDPRLRRYTISLRKNFQ